MSSYGVTEDLERALPWSWAEKRLIDNRNYWVVTASGSARPHAMPVWGVWIPRTDTFWFSCAPDARKVRNIRDNPQCVVMIDDTIECVSVEGRAEVVDPAGRSEAVDHALDQYVRKYWEDPADHPEMDGFLRKNTIVEVTPERAFGVIERPDEFSECATRWRW